MSDDERMQSLQLQIQQVQRTVRRLAVGLCASVALLLFLVLVGTGASLLGGEANSGVLRGSQFLVEDDQGRSRAMLGFDSEQGIPAMILWDEEGDVRAGIGVNVDGAVGISLFQKANPHHRLALIVHNDGTPELSLMDAAGDILARFNLTTESGVKLGLYADQERNVGIELQAAPTGAIRLSGEGHSSVSIGFDSKLHGPRLAMLGMGGGGFPPGGAILEVMGSAVPRLNLWSGVKSKAEYDLLDPVSGQPVARLPASALPSLPARADLELELDFDGQPLLRFRDRQQEAGELNLKSLSSGDQPDG